MSHLRELLKITCAYFLQYSHFKDEKGFRLDLSSEAFTFLMTSSVLDFEVFCELSTESDLELFLRDESYLD